jgi:hypothetical protein
MGPERGLDPVRYLSPERERTFPNLRREDYCVSSEEDSSYNCIAFAAGIVNTRWWPPVDGDVVEGVDWPKEAPPEESIEAFVEAYRTQGYLPCDTAGREEGFEKIAIYIGTDGFPSHVARQLMPSATWASKLGSWEDIRHDTFAALEGSEPAYGRVMRYLKRPIKDLFDPKCLPPIAPVTKDADSVS